MIIAAFDVMTVFNLCQSNVYRVLHKTWYFLSTLYDFNKYGTMRQFIYFQQVSTDKI